MCSTSAILVAESDRTSLAERHVGKDVHDIPLYAIPQIVNDACSR